MKFSPYSDRELKGVRTSGKILGQALDAVVAAVRPGMDVIVLNDIAEKTIRDAGGAPSFLGYHGYPATLCVSINNEVVHGIPRSGVQLNDGDIVGLDLGVIFDGMFTDMARTVAVGKVSDRDQQLIKVTEASLAAGLRATRAGATIGDIGSAVQQVAESAGFGVVRDLVGHGVGRAVHEDPSIPNFGKPHTGTKLKAGLVIAIEPMLTVGDYNVETDDDDGWTVRTVDGSRAAHEERTVLVTRDGYELLTPVNDHA